MFGEPSVPKPIELPTFPPPKLSVGVSFRNLPESTPQSKLFLLHMVNLLTEAQKVLPDKEMENFFVPGLDSEANLSEFQHFLWVGKKPPDEEIPQTNWKDVSGDISFDAVDYNYDGVSDLNYTIEGSIPFDKVKSSPTFGSSAYAVDYSGLWEDTIDIIDDLPGKTTYYQMILNENYDELFDTPEKKLALLVHLTEVKRRWIFGMLGIGRTPFVESMGYFNSIWLSWYGEGSDKKPWLNDLDVQALGKYYKVYSEVVKGFGRILGMEIDDSEIDPDVRQKEINFYGWLRDTALPAAKGYYTSNYASQIDNPDAETLDLDQEDTDLFIQKRNDLGDLANSWIEAKNAEEPDEELIAQIEEQITVLLGEIKEKLNGIWKDYLIIDENFINPLGQLALKEKEFSDLKQSFGQAIPDALNREKNLEDIISILDSIKTKTDEINTAQVNKNNKQAPVELLFSELTMEDNPEYYQDREGRRRIYQPLLFNDDHEEQISENISDKLKEKMKTPVGFVVSVIATNITNRGMNRIAQDRYKIQVEEKQEEIKMLMRAENRKAAERKADEGRMGQQAAARRAELRAAARQTERR